MERETMTRILHLILSVLLCGFLLVDIHNGETGFMLVGFSVPFWIAGVVSATYLASSLYDVLFENNAI